MGECLHKNRKKDFWKKVECQQHILLAAQRRQSVNLGGSPGLVVMDNDSCSRCCGFESRPHILDGHDIFHIDLLQKLYCLFDKTENKPKRCRGWPNCFKKCAWNSKAKGSSTADVPAANQQ